MAHVIPATPTTIDRVAARSLDLITSLQTPEGAYPASPTFSAYAGYCWLRDGSFIADGASAAGATASATRFFDWCAAVIERRAETIRWIVAETDAGRPPADEAMLPTRFTYAGDDGAVDWWEEHPRDVHTSTLACVVAGLEAAAAAGLVDTGAAERVARETAEARRLIEAEGVVDGHLVKRLGDDALDGSLAAAIAPLGVIAPDAAVARGTIAAIESHLTVEGGVHRYLGDTFYGGGQWPILSCFLGLAHLAAGERERAGELLDWAVGTASATLDLPEQVAGHLIAPGMRQEWIDRWGEVAEPLLWSHAMVLRLATALGRVETAAVVVGSER